MPARFLDTNILLRYLTRDDPDRAAAALDLLTRVEQGEERVVTSPLVIFETIFTLQKRYHFPKNEIRQAITDLISLRGLQFPNKTLWIDALDLFVSQNLPFVDAYNAVYLRSRGLSEIYSWDGDFDKIAGINARQPLSTYSPPSFRQSRRISSDAARTSPSGPTASTRPSFRTIT